MADASGNTLSLPSRNLCSRRGLLAATPALALAGGGAGGGGGGVSPVSGPDAPVTPAWRLLDAVYRTAALDVGDPALDDATIAAIDSEGEAARDTLYALRPAELADAVAMLLTLAMFADEPLGGGDVGVLLAVVGWLTRDAPHLARPDLAGYALREVGRWRQGTA